MRARAILFTGVGEIALADTEIPEPGPGEVVVAAAYTCVSPGTELRCLAGRQEGMVFPAIPGYSLSGTVVARGPGVETALGTAVYCGGTRAAGHTRMWGGHISHALVAEGDLFLLPEGLDLLDASLAHLAGIAYHGARVARTRAGEQVAVVGLGPIGQLAARCHAALGARVVGADRSPARVALLQGAGVEAVAAAGGLAEVFAPLMPGGADVVVDATGVPAVLPEALALAKDLPWGADPEGAARYVVQGSYPGDVAVPYQAAFLKELAFYLPRDTQDRDIHDTLAMMADGRLPVRDIISDVRPPERAPETYAALQRAPGDLLTTAFAWR